jgi:hypothetical protein
MKRGSLKELAKLTGPKKISVLGHIRKRKEF